MHGANYEALYKQFQLDMPKKVYDLSENVNYLGVPEVIKNIWPQLISSISTYPHPEAEPLRTLLAQKHDVASEQIVVGNGAAELLTFFAHRFNGKKVIIVHPTFSEYEQTLKAAGAELIDIMIENVNDYELPIGLIKQSMNDASCIYFCNPNNPTGALIKRNLLEQLIQYGQEVGCEIVVDEAFMDWTDEANSVIPLVSEFEHVTVFRSMTKMYSIAGIRLGYLVGSSNLVQQLKRQLPHWNVNGLANELGQLCLQDDSFRTKSIEKSDAIKKEITHFLQQHDCTVLNSAANFLCFQLNDQEKTRDFYFYCLKQGVVLRHTENYKGLNGKWLRIGMKDTDAMNALKNCIEKWYQS